MGISERVDTTLTKGKTTENEKNSILHSVISVSLFGINGRNFASKVISKVHTR